MNDVRLERDGVSLLQWRPIVLNLHLYVISHQIEEQGTLKKILIVLVIYFAFWINSIKHVTTKYSKNQLNIFPDESLCFHESVNEENMQGLIKVYSELESYALDFKVNPLCL